MNILFIAAREVNPQIGGIERVTYTLTEQWIQMGLNVYWLALEKSRWSPLDENLIVDQYFLPNSQDIQSDENVLFVQNLRIQYHIDIVINQATIREDCVGLCLKLKSNNLIKLISVIHFAPRTEYDIAKNNLFLLKEDKSLKNILRETIEFVYFQLINSQRIKNREKRILTNICQISDRIVVLSDGFIPEFKKICNSDKYQAISNPIRAENCYLPKKKKQVLYVARIEYGMKRFDRMLDIWTKVGTSFPDWELIVVGDGDYLPHFRSLAIERNLKSISFVGFQPPEPYYETASILCLTSTTEGFGMVLVEAMQYGCIPIAYDSYASLHDLIDDGKTGYMIKPFDESAFIQKLSLLMSDREIRQMMAEKCIEVPMKFSAESISNQWIYLFNQIIDS